MEMPSTQTVIFNVTVTIQSLKASVNRFYAEGKISSKDVYQGLMDKLNAAAKAKDTATRNNILRAFINMVNAQKGKAITNRCGKALIADAQWLMIITRAEENAVKR